jgi:hypothetical protein
MIFYGSVFEDKKNLVACRQKGCQKKNAIIEDFALPGRVLSLNDLGARTPAERL